MSSFLSVSGGSLKSLSTRAGRNEKIRLLCFSCRLIINEATNTVRIPNEEIRLEFSRTVKTAEAAIQQIKDNKYPEALRDYDGEILLVGISYDKQLPPAQRHYSCTIERLER